MSRKNKTRRRVHKPEYVLDTSVLRALSKDDVKRLVNRKANATFKASYLVPIEILSGTLPKDNLKSAEENKWRKIGLDNYYRLIGLNGTEWEDEDVIIARAFGAQRQGSDKREVATLVQRCVHSRTLEDLETESTRAKKLLEEIRQRDLQKVNAFLNGLETVKQGLQTYGTLFESRPLRPVIFFLFGQRACAIAEPQTDEEYRTVEQELKSRYDGSIDFIIDIWTEYCTELATKVMPIGKKRRNDGFDISHLYSIRRDAADQFFVTNDKNLRRLVEKVAPGRVLNTAEFLKRVLAS